LDARTGRVRWDTPTTPEGTVRRFTSGPIVAEGVIVAGMSSCNIVGLDGRTGRVLWRTSTVARPGEPGGDTWGDVPLEARAGGEAWMTGSYDPSNRTVYWGTAQAKPWSREVRATGGVELYTNSTLALDPRTGAIRWYYQHIPAESHDMDEAFERILVDYDGRRSVFTMGKLGILWELDRDAGTFRRAVDLGYQTLLDVDPETGAVSYRPGALEVGRPVHFCPSTGGFKSLRAMAFHPETQAFYVPLNLNCETGTFLPEGGVGDRQNHFHPLSPDQMGEFLAMDLRTGRKLWSQRRRAPYNTSSLGTGGGIVFVGAWDRYVFAYEARDGAQLWQARLPTMANGAPITYAVRGKQYVAFVAGPSISGSSWATIVPGDLLVDMKNPQGGGGVFVFSLP
jgi:alcohol dehydrogenase (cytochrome c)